MTTKLFATCSTQQQNSRLPFLFSFLRVFKRNGLRKPKPRTSHLIEADTFPICNYTHTSSDHNSRTGRLLWWCRIVLYSQLRYCFFFPSQKYFIHGDGNDNGCTT